jgi:hypothetical protein
VGRRVNQANTSPGWLVCLDDSTNALTLEVADAIAQGSDEYMVESQSTFASSGWNHFVITWDDDDASNINMYINGKLENSITKTGTLSNIGDIFENNRSTRIGTEHGGTGSPFDGKIDDIMLYGHIVSPWEVKIIYNQSSAIRFGPETGPPQ